MSLNLMNKRHLLIGGMVLSLAASASTVAYAQSKPKIIKAKPTPAAKKDDTSQSAEPDKVLYEKALKASKESKYIEARLNFQTLINTYPDSEYLAKAKLGIADSFYKEGGTSSLTQAVEEYKNFIVFFPFLDEAAYAQMQVGMAHYKMMEKADRDNSHAEAAEDEFRAFLLKYPQSPYVPQAEQSLRNVQEILAGGEFGIAKFYYTKKDYRASAARLVEVTNRYPLFSDSDEALWMLGDVYQRARQTVKNEDYKNQMADLAAKCYDRIVQDYPRSTLVPGAKAQLKAMNMPVPAPNPDALARMREQQLYAKQHHQLAVVKTPMNMIKTGPDVSGAAHSGAPNLNPPDDAVSAMEVLNPGAKGPAFSVVAVGGGGGGGGKAETGDTESVETDTPSSSTTAPITSAPITTAPAATAGVQILDAPNAAAPANPAPVISSPAPADPPVDSVPAATENTSARTSASPDAALATAATTSTAPQTGTSSPQVSKPSGSANSTTGAQATAAPSNPTTESTSKKKKGIHKIIPF
jgi:outer membrane protein assembly factor BamD